MIPDPETPAAPVSRRRGIARNAGPAFSAGEALASSFSTFGRQLPMLLLLAAAFHALPLWLNVLQSRATADAAAEAAATGTELPLLKQLGGPIYFVYLIVDFVLTMAYQAVVTFAVFQTLRGGAPRWGESIRQGVRRLPHALGASIVLGLAIGLPMAAVAMFAGLISLVLAAFLFCVWFVAVQAAVVEGVNPFKALGRSAVLTDRSRGGVFGVVLVVYVLPGLLLYAFQQVVLRPVAEGAFDMPSILLETAFGVLFGCLQAVASVVVYHLLRRAKEGVGLDELLAVFD